MTKELLKQALEALLSVKNHGWDEDTHTGRALITALKAALEQPVQEQQQAQLDVIAVNLMREGINKHRARELADHFVNFTLTPPLPVQRQPLTDDEARTLEALKYAAAKGYGLRGMKIGRFIIKGDETLAQPPLPVQPEPVKLRRGDTLRCIETDELCTVWATSTTNKTLIKWSANNFGNYTAEQIGELFWIEPQQAEPVTWDRPSASFNDWWDSDRHDNANPFEKDSAAHWAYEGWQAALAQRPWVGLTEQERNDLEDALGLFIGKPAFDAIEASLKELNK